MPGSDTTCSARSGKFAQPGTSKLQATTMKRLAKDSRVRRDNLVPKMSRRVR